VSYRGNICCESLEHPKQVSGLSLKQLSEVSKQEF
jgi:hypothetical protein